MVERWPVKSNITLLLVIALLDCFSAAQIDQGVKDALLKHSVIVRGYYYGPNLQFDQDGRLLSNATTGFGPTDGRIYIDDVEYTSDRLIIRGQRTLPVYDRKTKQFVLDLTGEKVTIVIALRPDSPTTEALEESLKKVFLTTAETQTKCTSEEQARFQELLSPAKDKDNKKKQTPEAKSIGELTAYCFPTGEIGYRADRGIHPPKALSTPDPDYSYAARQNREQGTVVFLVIVDQQGRPTTLHVVRSAGHSLDQAALKAVRQWHFAPAAFNGSPIPAAINVEVNFRLG
jgi:TonB family protein